MGSCGGRACLAESPSRQHVARVLRWSIAPDMIQTPARFNRIAVFPALQDAAHLPHEHSVLRDSQELY